MFSGRIDRQATVQEWEKRRERYFLLLTGLWRDLAVDELVSVNGIALRAHEISEKGAAFWVDSATAESTMLAQLQNGQTVNIERAPLLSERWQGHWVRGKIDTQGTLLNCLEVDGNLRLSLALAADYGKYCIPNGVVTVNGLAMEIYQQQLTKQGEFLISAQISKKTAGAANHHLLTMGTSVNIELDIIARYVERLINKESINLNSLNAAIHTP